MALPRLSLFSSDLRSALLPSVQRVHEAFRQRFSWRKKSIGTRGRWINKTRGGGGKVKHKKKNVHKTNECSNNKEQ